MPAVLDRPLAEPGAERRVLTRLEAAAEQFVLAARADGVSARAQVLDFNSRGMRLLFRPAIDLDAGMTIGVSATHSSDTDEAVDAVDAAQVQWCHHKRHFTVAGVRACGPRFRLDLESAA
jgi:hypothetical protein